MPFDLEWIWLATLPHLYNPLGFYGGPYPTVKQPFDFIYKDWGQEEVFLLLLGQEILSSFVPP